MIILTIVVEWLWDAHVPLWWWCLAVLMDCGGGSK